MTTNNQGLSDPFVTHPQRRQQYRCPVPSNTDPIQQPNMNHVQPPIYQIQAPRKPSLNMNELDILRIRSIELETELRLLKDQLLQAQSGTQYLVNCFANQPSRGMIQDCGQSQRNLEVQNQQLQTEIHRLKGELRLLSAKNSQLDGIPAPSSRNGRGWGKWSGTADEKNRRYHDMQIEIQEVKNQRDALLNDVLKLLKENENEYSFHFDDGDPARFKPLDLFVKKVARLIADKGSEEEESLLDGDLLGEEESSGATSDGNAAKTKNRVDSPRDKPTPMLKKHGIYIKPSDIALLDLDAEESKGSRDDGWEAPDNEQPIHPIRRSPPPSTYNYAPRRPRNQHLRQGSFASFMPAEHNWLMANAVFIEEKDLDEYLDLWEGLENGVKFRGRHSRDEWKAYYEQRVRPLFLKRMSEKRQAVGREEEGLDCDDAGEGYKEGAKEAGVEATLQVQEEAASKEDRGEAVEALRNAQECDSPVEENGDLDGREAEESSREHATTDCMAEEGNGPPAVNTEMFPKMRRCDGSAENAEKHNDWGAQETARDFAREDEDVRENMAPTRSKEVMVEIQEVTETGEPVEIKDLAPRKQAVGLGASMREDREIERSGFSDSKQNDAAGSGFLQAEDVSPKSRIASKQESPVTMPAVSAFDVFNSLGPQQPTVTAPSGPIPGLAGGWPKPAPRRSQLRFGPRFHTSGSEKDPQTWNSLFFSIQQKASNTFVLGNNEKSRRTVVITGIPVGMKLVDVLDRVRGGKIVGAKFFDTAGMKTRPPITSNTAVLEFLGSKQAKSFVDHYATHPLYISTDRAVEQGRLSVSLIATQTIRLDPDMQSDMLLPEGALTRILFLIFPNPSTAPAPSALAHEISNFAARNHFKDIPRQPLRINAGDDGATEFEYSDVRQAAAAWNVTRLWEKQGKWKEGEVSKGFASDPCARAFERMEVRKNGECEERQGREEQREKETGNWIERTERETADVEE